MIHSCVYIHVVMLNKICSLQLLLLLDRKLCHGKFDMSQTNNKQMTHIRDFIKNSLISNKTKALQYLPLQEARKSESCPVRIVKMLR